MSFVSSAAATTRRLRVVLTRAQRLQLSSILEGNKQIGRRRVEGWRSISPSRRSRGSLSSCAPTLPPPSPTAASVAWDGAACAQLCRNAGLGQYAAGFGSNLTGEKLGVLRCSDLPLLGIRDFAHQKERMAAVRAVVNAYERRDAVERARTQWDHLLAATAPAAARPPPRPAAAHSPPRAKACAGRPRASAAADGGDGGIGELYGGATSHGQGKLARTQRPAQSGGGRGRRGRRGRRATRRRLRRRRLTSCGWGLRRAARRSPT